jgi:hypothetical protein
MKPCRKCSRPLTNRATECAECGWRELTSDLSPVSYTELVSDDHQKELGAHSTTFVIGWFASRAVLLIAAMIAGGCVGWYLIGTTAATIGLLAGAILCAVGFLSEVAG